MENVKAEVYNIYNKEGWTVLTEHDGQQFDDRAMISDPLNGMVINATHYPTGFYKGCHRHGMSHGIFVISGHLKTDDGVYGPGSLVWHPAGYQCAHGAPDDDDCLFLFITNHAFDIEFLDGRPEFQSLQPSVYDIHDKAGWEKKTEPDGKTFETRNLITDPDTGMFVNVSHLPAGCSRAEHKYPIMAHGVYVVEGKLKTGDGVYGPGTLLWCPAGYEGSLAAADDAGCTYLFIADKEYEIQYL